jgi:hypothetical protein
VSEPAPFTTKRLIAILERMGSDHDGEALAAARMAHRMVRENGRTWAALIVAAADPKGAFAVDAPIAHEGRWIAPPHERSWVATALFLVRHATSMTSRIPEADRSWLVRQAAVWRQRPLKGFEADRLAGIYERLMAPVTKTY